MPVQRLSKRSVEAASPSHKPIMIWDTDLKGFGLKVTPTGRKVYLIQYRSGKRSRRITLGRHGTLTTEQARQKAKLNLGRVAAGDDPAAERDKRKKSNQFQKYSSYLLPHILQCM